MKRRQYLEVMGIALVAAGLSRCTSLDTQEQSADTQEKPIDRPSKNVLFIAVDDLNHWCGYTKRNKQVKTPNIDRLSKMGVSFTNAHCAAPACNASRAAVLSGLRPSTSGCYTNKHFWQKYIPKGISLNVTFKEAGYHVMGVGKIFHKHTLDTLYTSEWDEYASISKNPTGGATADQGYLEPLPLDMKDEDLADWDYVSYCIEKLQKKYEKPFFLSCGLQKPHLPWAVPKKYYDMFPLDQIELPPHIKDDLADIPEAGRNNSNRIEHQKFLNLGRWKDAVQSYLATIAYADVCIGRLLDALENSAYKNNTIVVLWGDHGWHLGEKEHWRKSTLWEEATRAPMVWYAPGVTKPNTICNKPVDLMSIYPTLLELTEIDKPEHLEGRSIVPLLKNPTAMWDGVAVTTDDYMNHAVRTQRWRYIRYANGDRELYDHNNDEYEWTNLAEDPVYAPEIERLSAYFPKINVKNTPILKQDKKWWN